MQCSKASAGITRPFSAVIAVVLSVVLALSLTPILSFADEGNGGQSETTQNAPSDLGVLVTSMHVVPFGETQQFAIVADDTGRTMTAASLTVRCDGTGLVRDIAADQVEDNAASVLLPYDDPAMAGTWHVVNVTMTWQDGSQTSYDPSAEYNYAAFVLAEQGTDDASGISLLSMPNEADETSSSDGQTDDPVSRTRFLSLDDDEVLVNDGTFEATAPIAGAASSSSGISLLATPLIALDPGHGGGEAGANENGVDEAEVNWKITKYAEQHLNELGIRTVLVRQYNEYMTVRERVQKAVDAGATAIVSFHNNSSSDKDSSGAMVLIPNDSSYKNYLHDDGVDFANRLKKRLAALGIKINSDLIRDYGGDSAEAKYPDGSSSDYYGIVRYARRAGILGVIIEHLFVSNPQDAELLRNESFLQRLGYADAEAIAEKWGGISVPVRDENIMGTSATSKDKLKSYFASQFKGSKTYPTVYAQKGAATPSQFVDVLWDQASKEGVRPDVLLAQVALETGWLQFGGLVDANQCNFGGIGATGDGVSGATFPNVATGLLAQAQHLKAYASTDRLNTTLVDPRFEKVKRGIAPTVQGLSGRWADGYDYGSKIIGVLDKFPNDLGSSHEVEAPVVQQSLFNDVSPDEWCYNDIQDAAVRGYMNGYGNGKFGPYDTLIRAQAACVLFNMANGSNDPVNQTRNYQDVSANDYFFNPVYWATERGILHGYDGTNAFGPYDWTTREQFAVMMANYAKYRNTYEYPGDVDQILAGYADGWRVSPWARESVAWAAKNRIMGVNCDLNPGASITRAETAAMLNRVNYPI